MAAPKTHFQPLSLSVGLYNNTSRFLYPLYEETQQIDEIYGHTSISSAIINSYMHVQLLAWKC